MKRTRLVWAMAAAVIFLAAIGLLVGNAYFFPEKARHVDDAAPDDAVTVKQGQFEGAGDGVHHVSGEVRILAVGAQHVLRFENYDQTQGPDVFVYLTSSGRPGTKGEVESGLRVLIDGGADGGESTKEGSFQQALPADFDPTAYEGVAIWCDRFDVLFGRATLTPTSP